MNLSDIVEILGATVVTKDFDGSVEASSGFVGDLLSVVMGKAKEGCAWVTIQSHINVVAVASLVEMSCVIVAEGFVVDEDALKKADAEGIPVMTTQLSSYESVALLAKQGLA